MEVVIGPLILDLQSTANWHGQRTPKSEVEFAKWKAAAYYTPQLALSPLASAGGFETSLVTDIPVVRLESLASMISDEIMSLLCMKFRNIFCNDLLFERVDRIQLKADSAVVTELKLDEMLANLAYRGWFAKGCD
ncbi:hypothetical protein EMCG_03028 [[Emmonsia] crescens]|uniref:Uncharacterized protein n=1 Tax=[Emmonsia] crescens TaxID=73230 RepID=A0A0G2HWZ9_9EURO|nr:hypothetical protein EMCG_03028 [Emmonsia crescens UAMH 3008]